MCFGKSLEEKSLRRITMGTLRVLVADDHEIVRKGLRSILEEQPGWEVAGEGRDGPGGGDKDRSLKPDGSVVDVSKPGLKRVGGGRPKLEEKTPKKENIPTHDEIQPPHFN